jgi:hypothetical protein
MPRLASVALLVVVLGLGAPTLRAQESTFGVNFRVNGAP